MVYIPIDVSTVAYDDDFTGPDYTTTYDTPDINFEPLTWGKRAEMAFKVELNERADMTVDLIAQYGMRRLRKVGQNLDVELATLLNAVNLSAVADDPSAPGNTNPQQTVLGNANNFIPKTGATAGDSTGSAKDGAMVFNALRRHKLILAQNHKDIAGMWDVPMPRHLIFNLESYLMTLTNPEFEVEVVEGRTRMNLFGRYRIVETENIPDMNISSKDHSVFYVMRPEAATWARRFILPVSLRLM